MTAGSAETARWVADNFGLVRVRSMEWVARGAVGEVHRLVTDTGAYAVKRAFWREDPDGVVESRARHEVAFVERCLGAGLLAPRPVLARDGSVLVRDASGTGWRVHVFAPGVVPDRSDLAARAVAVGTEWAPRMRARAAEFGELGARATSVPLRSPVLCHRDLKANNTLVERDGTRWLVDWDDVGAHDPAREVGTVLLHHVPDEAALGLLAAAYGAAGGAPLPEGPELFASGVAVWLNVLAGQVGVLLDAEAEPEHRAFALPKVRGLLEDVPAHDVLVRCGVVAARTANRERRVRPPTMGP